jgi:hypothetical protein
MAIKFTDLPTANTLSADDLFAVTIDSTNVSQSVSFATLKNLIVDAETFSDPTNLANLKSALNGNNSGLNSDLLDGQHGSHYLDYGNLQNKPIEKTDLDDFDNSQFEEGTSKVGGFLKIRPSDNKIIFQKKEGGVNNPPAIITTTNLDEGVNKYFTEDRVTEYFDQYFANYFNKYNVTFDQGNVNDSYTDTVGYAPTTTFSGETSTIRIKAEGRLPGVNNNYQKRQQAVRFASYQKGKALRIYGADSSTSADAIDNNASIASIETVGFETYDDNSVGATPTFNAVTGVAPGTDTITTIANHNFSLGQEVIYSSGGAGAITGLIEGATYYVFSPTATTLKLIDTPGSNTPKSIDTGTGATHTLTPVEVTNPFQRITYTFAEWDMTTGKISPIIEEISTNIGVVSALQLNAAEQEEYLTGNVDRILESFSVENFIKLSFSHLELGVPTQGITPGRGICIYRRVSQVNTISEQLKGEPRLIAVLGPLELRENYWIDYFTDDLLTHAGKNLTTNAYIPENTVHFTPHELPSSNGGKGWVDATIDSVIYQNDVNPSLSTYIDVKLTGNIITDAGEEAGVWISHDDTAAIQGAIDTNSATGRKAIQFNPKNYVVSSLSVPSNFSIAGYAYNTKLTKLPWSGWTGSSISSSARMIKAASVKLQNTSFVGFDIDGNSGNSVAYDDRTDISRNYAVDFGSANNSILLDKVRLSRPIGGGVFATDPVNLKIIGCEFIDSGITDRHVYSPLIADGGSNTSISSNRFENFSKGSVDCSITDQGAIEGNIISNCGSGLLAFGSRFMITSPNVLTGPAGEFLPQPDSFNSEFDSINVDLTESSLHASGPQGFDSGPHTYQENGELYDLGTPGPIYKMFAIKKEPVAGEESIWIKDLRPPTGMNADTYVATFNAANSGSYDTTNDRIIISAGHGLNTGDVVYYSAGTGGIPQTSSGLVEGASYFVHAHNTTQIELFTNYSHALAGTGASQLDFSGGTTGASGTAHTLTRNSFLQIAQGVEADNPASKGGFQWTIPADTVSRMKLANQPYTIESMKDATKNVYHRDDNGDFAMTAGDPDHVGIGWSASITQYVSSAMIVNNAGNPGVWSQEGNDHFYTVTVRDYKYLVVDRKVKPQELGMNSHNNFDTGGSTSEYGIITDIGAGEEEKVIKIRWPGANAAQASGGNGGILLAENTFVIATGRIK